MGFCNIIALSCDPESSFTEGDIAAGCPNMQSHCTSSEHAHFDQAVAGSRIAVCGWLRLEQRPPLPIRLGDPY
jgi:hypothetical protein